MSKNSFFEKITCWACQYAFKNVKIGMFYVLNDSTIQDQPEELDGY